MANKWPISIHILHPVQSVRDALLVRDYLLYMRTRSRGLKWTGVRCISFYLAFQCVVKTCKVSLRGFREDSSQAHLFSAFSAHQNRDFCIARTCVPLACTYCLFLTYRAWCVRSRTPPCLFRAWRLRPGRKLLHGAKSSFANQTWRSCFRNASASA